MGFASTRSSMRRSQPHLGRHGSLVNTGTFVGEKGEAKIGEVTRRIEEELRSQYILAFRTDSQKPDGEYRMVAVSVDKPGVTARTIKGYIP